MGWMDDVQLSFQYVVSVNNHLFQSQVEMKGREMTFILLFFQCVCCIGLIILLTSYFGSKINYLCYQRDVLYRNLGVSLLPYEVMPKDLEQVCDQIDKERKR